MNRRRRDTPLHVWPALTDLMVGMVVTLLIVLVMATTQSERRRQDLIDSERLRKQLESESRRLGVGRALVERLQSDLAAQQVQARVNEYGNLEVSADILFGTGQDVIPREKQANALRLGKVVFEMLGDEDRARAVAILTVVGHTDQVGEDAANRLLSTRRALALVDLWLAKIPIPENRERCVAAKLMSAGMGESRPLVSDESSSACANLAGEGGGCRANRRIEIRITPKDKNVAEVAGCP